MREIETLGAELKRSREEMDKSRAEVGLSEFVISLEKLYFADFFILLVIIFLESHNICFKTTLSSFCIYLQIKRLQGELRHSETRREEVERKASQAAENAMKLTDVENQMEEIKKENYNLTTQVFN